jgi:hypothetical protein
MIENVDFSSLGPNPNEFDYMYILKKKIDEIIDFLNASMKAPTRHINGMALDDFVLSKGVKVWEPEKKEPNKCLVCGKAITYSRIYGDPRFCCDQHQNEYTGEENESKA